MINWILITIIPFGVIGGMEFGRRKQAGKGEIFCFQPYWSYLTLSFILAPSVALFVESARVSLSNPTPNHIHLLIFSATLTMLTQLLITANEHRYARRRVKELGG